MTEYSIAELKKQLKEESELRFEKNLEYMLKAKEVKDWDMFELMAVSHIDCMYIAFDYLTMMPEERKREFIYSCYMDKGDNIGICRKEMRKLPKRGTKELPSELAAMPEIFIYRAGEEPPEKARFRISWTIDPNIALWFSKRHRYRHPYAPPRNLYKAKIRPCDVIGFSDDRKEKEVFQYGKAYNIEIITPKDCEKNGR